MSNVTQLKNKARREEQRENWSRAIELYTDALDASRREDEAFADLSLYNRIGDIYLRIGQKNTAVRYYEQAIERYAEQDLHTSAIALCNKVLRIHPERSTIFLQLGRLHLATNLIADARAHYHKYAESMRERGTDEAAVKALEELIDETGDAQTLDLWLSWLVELADHDVVLGRIDEVRNRLISHGIDPDRVLERVPGGETAARDEGPTVEAEPDPLAGAFLSVPEPDIMPVASTSGLAIVEEPTSAAAEVEIPEPTPIEFGSAQWDDEAEELLSELNQPIEATWAAHGEELSSGSSPVDAGALPAPGPELDSDPSECAVSVQPGEYEWMVLSPDLDREVEDEPSTLPDPAPGPECGEVDAASATLARGFGSPSGDGEPNESNAASEGIEPATPILAFDDPEFGKEDPWSPPDAFAFDAEPMITGDELPAPEDEEPVEPDSDPPLLVDSFPSLEEPAVEDVLEAGNPLFASEPEVLVETSEETPVESLAYEEPIEPDSDPPLFVESFPSLEEPAVEDVLEAGNPLLAAEPEVFVETSEETPAESILAPPEISFAAVSTTEEDEGGLGGDDAWVQEARSAMLAASDAPPATSAEMESHPASVTEIAVAPTPAPDPEGDLEIVHEQNAQVAITHRDEMTGRWAESRLVVEEDPEDAFRDWVRSASPGVLRRALTELENRSETEKALLVIRQLCEQESSGVEYRTRLVDHLEKLGRTEPAAEACLALGAALERDDLPGEARTAYLRLLRIEPSYDAARAALDRLEDAALPGDNEEPEARPMPYMPDHVTSIDSEPLLAPIPRVDARNGNGGGLLARPYSGVSGGAAASADLEQLLSEFRAELHQHPVRSGSSSRTELGASLKEMGRLDDAIRELQAAVREPSPPPLAFELLGEVFLEKGQGRIAAKLLEKALGSLGQSDREILGVLYQLGMAYESLTEAASALGCYERIFSVDIDYRDIQARIVSCST